MNFANQSPKTIKNIFIALSLVTIPIGVIVSKIEKGLYFGFAFYWIFTLVMISFSQKAIIYQRIEKGQPSMNISPEKANKLQNIYLTTLSIALIGAIVYDHIKL